VEAGTFPGGCFFASTLFEMSMQPGPVRDRIFAFLDDWMGRLEGTIKDAQREGSIREDEDAGQLAFELESSLLLANTQFVAHDSEPIKRAQRAIDRRLDAAVT
jgi:hypothetical protein